MKRTLALLMSLCLLLCGCQSQPEQKETTAQTTAAAAETTAAATAEPTTEPTTGPTEEPAAEPTSAPTEPPILYRHPLTGEALEAPFGERPVAVVINNIRQAQPLHGIGEADILYEITAEGGGSITRCLAVFTDLEKAEKVGSIRSARTYLIDLARAHDAVLVHCGGSEYAYDELKQTGWDNLDQMYNGSYFYRDTARQNSGYAFEHTLFAKGEKLLEGIAKKKYDTDFDREVTAVFAEDATPDGESAATIEIGFYKNGKRTVLEYDRTAGVYYAQQKWRNSSGNYSYTGAFADKNTGETLPFENVFILYMKTTSDGYRMFTEQVGSGEGYYACGGKIVPIKWSRESTDSPFVYTLTDGTPLTQGIGKTYVGILPGTTSPVNYS